MTVIEEATVVIVPRWLRSALQMAGVYNMVWGVSLALVPRWSFDAFNLPVPNYTVLWQGLGTLIAVHGLGYVIAARNPVRHWPIIFIGLLGKVLAPLGFVWGAVNGELPWRAGTIVLLNDVVWWIPFAMLLWHAARDHAAGVYPRSAHVASPREAMTNAVSDLGDTLLQLSESTPRLVVFLRHTGCIFCKEALADLRDRRGDIERTGVKLVVVHMGMPDEGEVLLGQHSLGGVDSISDPLRELYQAFRLRQGSFIALFGPKVFMRGMAATLRGHTLSALEGDGLQMPGVFVVSQGAILRSYRHASAGDRPDYVALARGECDFPAPGSAQSAA